MVTGKPFEAKRVDETPNDAKLGELILYVAQKCQEDPTFGATKLNKILFYSDFTQFGRKGRTITGQAYQKIEFGPAPRLLKPVQDSLMAKGDCAIQKRMHFGRVQYRTIATREADLDAFTGEDIAVVDSIIADLWGMTATETSDLSHLFVGWLAFAEGDTIPPETVFVSGRKLTQEEKDYALGLEPSIVA